MMWGLLVRFVLLAAPLAFLFFTFNLSVPALIVHTLTAVTSTGVPSTTSSLELEAFHKILRSNNDHAKTVEELRAGIDDFISICYRRTPYGGGSSLPHSPSLSSDVVSDIVINGVPTTRVYWPGGKRHDHAIIAIHGGAYIAGFPKMQLPYLERLSRRTGAVVYAPDYSLRPENSIANAVNEVVGVFRWIVKEKKIPASRIIITGDSAGGGMTALVTQKLIELEREEEKEKEKENKRDRIGVPAGIVLLSPWVDLSSSIGAASYTANEDKDVMVKKSNEVFASNAVGDLNPKDASISPYFGSVSGFPPTFLLVSSTESLFDEGVAFAQKIKEEGGNRIDLYIPDVDLPHIWPALNLPESVEDTAIIAKWMVDTWAESN